MPSAADSKGGFDTSMLEKVASKKQNKEADKDSDDNWSDDDSSPTTAKSSVRQSLGGPLETLATLGSLDMFRNTGNIGER